MTYLFSNLKFVPFDPVSPPSVLHRPTLAATNLVSVAMPSSPLLNSKNSISSVPAFFALGEIMVKEEGGEEGKVAPTDN